MQAVELKKLIKTCNFLPMDYASQWDKNAENLPEYAIDFVYKKFSDAKKKVDYIYIKLAIQNDKDGELTTEITQTLKK